MNTSGYQHALHALRGQSIIVVGGDRRDEALDRLRAAFDLREVIHCPTCKNDASSRSFEARLHSPGIVLAIWVLGLSRTHHGKHLHRLCRSAEIPWVDCFRIPHPNRLAAEICELHLLEAIRARGTRPSLAIEITIAMRGVA
jgi:hypothetical protein